MVDVPASYYCISNYWRVIPNSYELVSKSHGIASPLPLQTFGFEQQQKKAETSLHFEAILRVPEHKKKQLTHIDTQIYETSTLRKTSLPVSWDMR